MDRTELPAVSISALGPTTIRGFTGQPSRDQRRATELLTLLATKRQIRGTEISSAMAISLPTVRSMTAHLRRWIGHAASTLLPPAYDGHYRLAPQVRSDWERLQLLLGIDAPSTSSDALDAALRLVRGVPIADARPGTYGWADALRIELAQLIRDAAHESASRATSAGALDRARWAIGRGLTGSPDDELLLSDWLRVEWLGGSRAEARRIVDRLTIQDRLDGLQHATRTLLSTVIAGL